MIDTHAHLEAQQFTRDRFQVIERFFQQGGRAMLTMGTNEKTIKRAIRIAQSHHNIFAGIGYHPEEIIASPAESVLENALRVLREHVSHPKVVAIGEIGLEYYHIREMPEKERTRVRSFQQQLLAGQLNIANQYQLPAVLHCRDAYDDLFLIISQPEYKHLPMVIHCYAGTLAQTERFLSLPNLMFSFTGTITFVPFDGELLKVVKKIPLTRIMAETDCPYLAPVPVRGKRNEPIYTRYILERIADIQRLSFQVVEQVTDSNAIRFFKLPII